MPAPAQPSSTTSAPPHPPDDSLPLPSSIKINVQGAFIVDEESESPPLEAKDDDIGYKNDTKDIRLPNHKAIVSHVAVDVRPWSSNLRPV